MSNRLITRNEEKRKKSRLFLHLLMYGGVLAVVVFAWVLKFSGQYLVANDPFKGLQYAFVLEGQGRDLHRTDFALKLLQEGKVDTVVVSGVRAFKNRYLSEFYVENMLEQGADMNRLIALQHDARSTFQEALVAVPHFRELKVDTVLLITSAFHSARAKRILNRVSGGKPFFKTVDIKDPVFRPDNWIYDRESRKLWFYEVTKSVINALELMGYEPPKKMTANWNRWVHAKDLSTLNREGQRFLPVLQDSLEVPPEVKDSVFLENKSLDTVNIVQ